MIVEKINLDAIMADVYQSGGSVIKVSFIMQFVFPVKIVLINFCSSLSLLLSISLEKDCSDGSDEDTDHCRELKN